MSFLISITDNTNACQTILNEKPSVHTSLWPKSSLSLLCLKPFTPVSLLPIAVAFYPERTCCRKLGLCRRHCYHLLKNWDGSEKKKREWAKVTGISAAERLEVTNKRRECSCVDGWMNDRQGGERNWKWKPRMLLWGDSTRRKGWGEGGEWG